MTELYDRISRLCADRGIKPGKMCSDLGLSRGMMSDLKMGRTKALSAKNTQMVADYFGVSVDFLLGREVEKTPTPEGERRFSDDDLKFALWGDAGDMDDDDLEDVRRYAAFVAERKKKRQ